MKTKKIILFLLFFTISLICFRYSQQDVYTQGETYPGPLIVVGGRYQDTDNLQDNIYNVTNNIYDIWLQNGATTDDIYYLANDLTLDANSDNSPDVNDLATFSNLEYAIKEWSATHSTSCSLTIYLFSHGTNGSLFLDGAGDTVTSSQLQQILSARDVNMGITNSNLNVVIDTVDAGQFILDTNTLSGQGRVMITSTSDNGIAYASDDGSIFSDPFLASLGQGNSFLTAFNDARSAIEASNRVGFQIPWLDDNGDSLWDESTDGALADTRGFNSRCSRDNTPLPTNTPIPSPTNTPLPPTSTPMGGISVAPEWGDSNGVLDTGTGCYTRHTAGTDPWDVFFGIAGLTLDAYTEYLVTVDATGNGEMVINVGNENPPYASYVDSGSVTLTSTPQQISFTFIPGERLLNPSNLTYQVGGVNGSTETCITNAYIIPQRTVSPTPTETSVPTNTPTHTPIPTNTPTHTPVPTSTPTPMIGLPTDGDVYENDDVCSDAQMVETNGTIQTHTFHDETDSDWVRFDVVAGKKYVVSGDPTVESETDLILELFNACNAAQIDNQAHTYSTGVRKTFEASSTGQVYLNWRNETPDVHGSDVAYHVSVRELGDEADVGATIIVAGRLNGTDPLQDNIQEVTQAMYNLFTQNGYGHDDIYYLSTLPSDANRDGVDDKDALATKEALRLAIIDWANDKVGLNKPLNIYLMDHGSPNKFYVDNTRNEVVRPSELNAWISEVEANHPGLIVNIILEMCNAGSFIEDHEQLGETLSAPNRVVIASTGPYVNAYASPMGGATFSDHFIPALNQKLSLYTSFERGRDAAAEAHLFQEPWIDADGDGRPNTINDYTEASQRGFGIAGSFDTSDLWPPYIKSHTPVMVDSSGDGDIVVTILDDPTSDVRPPYAIIYPPSYVAPEPGDELVWEPELLTTIQLLDQGSDQWGATFPGFSEEGMYRIVIHAQDTDGLLAQPYSFNVPVGDVNTESTPLSIGISAIESAISLRPLYFVTSIVLGTAIFIYIRGKWGKIDQF